MTVRLPRVEQAGTSHAATTLNWYPCRTADCSYEVHVCQKHARLSQPQGVRCESCWKAHGRMCIACETEPAQTERRLRRCCRTCFSKHFADEEYELVKEESVAYVE